MLACANRYGYVAEQVQADLDRGRRLLVLGRTGEASDALTAARGVLIGLRAHPPVAESDEPLARATALSS